MPGQQTKFNSFKQQLYLWVLPLLILAIVSSYWNWEGPVTVFDSISLILIIWFTTAWVLIYKQIAFRFVEIVTLGISSITHLITTFYTLIWIVQEQQETIGSSSYWTTLIYIYIFITLRGKAGASYSFALWLATYIIVLLFWPELNPKFKDSFTQYMLANLVYISFLFATRKIMRTYTESELLEKMAYQDSLTGIANRRQLHIWIDERIKQKPEHMSVIFFDIDHFKRINDQFGHLVGDQVLLEITTLVKNNLDPEAYFGRWGGEEFVIITNESLSDTARLAEKLRNIVGEHCFPKAGNVTSSFGVDTYRKNDYSDTLLDRADTALYLAKEAGRNMVKVYEENKT